MPLLFPCSSFGSSFRSALRLRGSILTRLPRRGTGPRLLLRTGFFAALGCAGLPALHAAPAPAAPDVIVFTNGDQLSGKFLRSAGGTVTFHSDIAGDVNVPWDKVKELRSGTVFAVFEKGQHLTKTPLDKVPQGTVTIQGDKLEVRRVIGWASGGTTEGAMGQGLGEAKEIAFKNTDFVIDETTFLNEVRHEPNLLHGWAGSLTGGASFVEATQNTMTFNGAVAMVRVVPGVNWLLPRNRTTANFNGSYGKITQPQAAGAPSLPDVKTAVYHADAERDEYFSPRFYVLAETAFDHNFAQGLDLQQIYGGGVGVTILKRPIASLDLKATVQYEKQLFLDGAAGTSQNLIGSTFSEAYLLKLPHNIVFSEQGSYLPAYNNMHDYSANETSNIGFPLYKRLSFSVGSVDTYLNDPPVESFPAAPNKRNSFELTTGVSYSLGPH
jgi:hypothetical protein